MGGDCPGCGTSRWAWRRAFGKMLEHRGERGLDSPGWPDADAVFDWWMDDSRHEPEDDAQCELFGGGMA